MEGDNATGVAAVPVEAANEDDGIVTSWLVVDDETAAELSELLDSSEAAAPPEKVRFADDPYSMPVAIQSSSAYVTINCNEESCGSSFSGSDSSVMASVDVGGGGRGKVAWVSDCGAARGWLAEGDVDIDVGLDGFLTDGCDSRDDGDDAMWAYFLLDK